MIEENLQKKIFEASHQEDQKEDQPSLEEQDFSAPLFSGRRGISFVEKILGKPVRTADRPDL